MTIWRSLPSLASHSAIALIVSIDSTKLTDLTRLVDTYGNNVTVHSKGKVHRIILTEPPELPEDESLPGWVRGYEFRSPRLRANSAPICGYRNA